jgi:hypothetical protein
VTLALQTAVDISVEERHKWRFHGFVRQATTWREVVQLQIASNATGEQVLQDLVLRLPGPGVGVDGMAIRPPDTDVGMFTVHTERTTVGARHPRGHEART